MAQSTTSPTTCLSTEDFPPLSSNTTSSSGHSSGPVRPNRATPTRDPKAGQRDRVRSHETDRARQDAMRSGTTAPKNLSSALNKEGKLHVNQAMDARFAAAGMGVDEYGNGDYGTPMPPPTGDPKAYHVPQHCEKAPSHSAHNAGWAWTQSWCSSISESPQMHAERTVPPTSENPHPNARPMPAPGSLLREDTDILHNSTSAYHSGQLCHRQQRRRIEELPRMTGGRTIPGGPQNPPPTARPMPDPQRLPDAAVGPNQIPSSACTTGLLYHRRQIGTIDDPPMTPRGPTVPDVAEDPPPSRRQPQTPHQHDGPPDPGCRQWHTTRAALQPGPDPLALRQGRGQAPAPPRPALASSRVGLRANHENLHSQWRLIPHLVDLDSLDPQLRLTHLGAEASLDPRIPPPLADTRGTGGDERDRSYRSPRDPSSHPLTPSPHRRARRRPRSRRRGRRWDPHRSPAQHPLGGCTRPERDLLLPSPISDAIHKLLPDVFPSGDARRRRRLPRRRAGPSSRRQSSVRGWRKRSTSLHTQATAAFHFFAREGGGSFPLLCTRKRR